MKRERGKNRRQPGTEVKSVFVDVLVSVLKWVIERD